MPATVVAGAVLAFSTPLFEEKAGVFGSGGKHWEESVTNQAETENPVGLPVC
ncbi:hypothetical protein [Candidatus Methylacidithermus pantelleriae]|uniref:Uncharacterized protein n=1 Tax=Candidatus Methylacidithermus pantelleriae TaxID=2744239 RepID=A0A8J2BIP7_9BACT|nr:hypothetical protein [Candidatus Methylacidithermus pantelleriae]CAF0698306.1 hypothetical protein MPNT_260003 [Candidatus Methylacidithermus pantelleriae]